MKTKECLVTCSAAFADYFSEKILGRREVQPAAEPVVFQKEEFEPTVFVLCAENNMVNIPLFPFHIDSVYFNISKILILSYLLFSS